MNKVPSLTLTRLDVQNTDSNAIPIFWLLIEAKRLYVIRHMIMQCNSAYFKEIQLQFSKNSVGVIFH